MVFEAMKFEIHNIVGYCGYRYCANI